MHIPRVPPDPMKRRAPKPRIGKVSAPRAVLSDRDRPIFYALLFTFTLFALLTYALPEDVLSRNPWLDNLVEKIATVAPAVNRWI